MLSRVLKPGTPGILEALRCATRSQHENLAASSAMARLFHAAYTVSEYRAHLGQLLGLLEPLERAAADVTNSDDVVHTLRRTSSLREDLRIMGGSPGEISALKRCRQLPAITRAGLPGYNYVILGSMLGGKIIVKRLRAVLGPDASLLFYGDGIGKFEALWASFCADLNENGEHDVQEICATAVRVFDAYAAWLSQPLPKPGNC
jgi:heme oxygenase (biliverdin-IX-beta and delta-forming)